MRAADQVTGIVLHHTATGLGEWAPRWESVVAHYGITRGGKTIKIHDPKKIIGHGGCNKPPSNGWNVRCLGIEIDGRLFGIYGNQTSVWNNPEIPGIELGDEFLPRQRQALINLVGNLCEEYPSIKFLVSHRQSSWSRQADPGQQVWTLALELMKKHNLTDGGDGFCIDSGRPNPREWDPSRTKYGYWDAPPNYKP